jgi:hypothetical protein
MEVIVMTRFANTTGIIVVMHAVVLLLYFA